MRFESVLDAKFEVKFELVISRRSLVFHRGCLALFEIWRVGISSCIGSFFASFVDYVFNAFWVSFWLPF